MPNTQIEKNKRILLAGNINVGKSVLFNRLCGGRAKEVILPETNVKINIGKISGENTEIIDAPGTSSIYPQSEDEAAILEILLSQKIDTIIFVADAKNLRRSLILFYQLAEFDIPMILNLNMIDEAEQRGITINQHELEKVFKVPVNSSIASEGEGISSLKKMLSHAKIPKTDIKFSNLIEEAAGDLTFYVLNLGLNPYIISLLLLANDSTTWNYIRKKLPQSKVTEIQRIVDEYSSRTIQPLPILVTEVYSQYAEKIISKVQTVTPQSTIPFLSKLGRWTSQLSTGIPIAIILLTAIYYIVGKIAGVHIVDYTEGILFDDYIIPIIRKITNKISVPYLEYALVGHENDALHDFGIISVGIRLAFGFVGPILLFFFFFFGILEDSGYFPRLSVLMDKFFRKIGLTGKGVLPLVMGFNCITISILMARILDKEKEKIILILILMAGIPCAPLLGVMLALLGQLNWMAALAVFGTLFINVLFIGILANIILKGERSDFILELPPLRIPNFKSLAVRSIKRTVHFLKEAAPMFIIASFLLFILDEIGFLDYIEDVFKPILGNLVGLPHESFRVFLMTAIRREAGAGLLYEISQAPNSPFDGISIVINLVVMTILMPCLNASLVMFKELKWRAAVIIFLFTIPYSLFVGWLMNIILHGLGITFH